MSSYMTLEPRTTVTRVRLPRRWAATMVEPAWGVQARRVPPGGVGAAQLGRLGLHGPEEAGPAAVGPGRGQGLGGIVGRDQQKGGEQLVAPDPPAGLVAEAGA